MHQRHQLLLVEKAKSHTAFIDHAVFSDINKFLKLEISLDEVYP